MITLKITRMWIEHITRIEVTEPEDFEDRDYCQRRLTISAENGERYDLILEADTLQKLMFIPQEGFIPKLYKGSKAMRREEEE
jgi:hypothetical protein